MGKYCSSNAVMVRLEGKVKFGNPGEFDDNKMSLVLLNTLISEAESQLEIDLMDRYELPFQRALGGNFGTLPDNTRITLQNLAELISVIRVLETDFGRGTSSNGEKYVLNCQKRYDSVISKLMEKRKVGGEETREWLHRPLDWLAVAYNNQADNGFRGRVSTTHSYPHEGEYAIDQLNTPSENVFQGLGEGHWER